MGLHIGKLRLHDFRNYEELVLEDIGNLVIFVGANAVGKTNIIEAIQLLTSLDTFRNASAEQLVRFGEKAATIQAQVEGESRKLDLALSIDGTGKRYRLNGKQRPRRELIGMLPSVLFTPDDLQLVKGGPERRRLALDQLGCQVSKNYYAVKRDYEKLLKQKNQLLKDEMPSSYLQSVNEVLVKIGSQFFEYRMKIATSLRGVLADRHKAITGSSEEVSLEYRPSWLKEGQPFGPEGFFGKRALVEELLRTALEQREGEERARHTSLIGPHRDKPYFIINGKNAADFASQGQQRSLSISYKLSELLVVEELTGQKPILLLDDVMSELDEVRRTTLVGYVQDAVQTFITTTNIDYFTDSIRASAQIIRLPLD